MDALWHEHLKVFFFFFFFFLFNENLPLLLIKEIFSDSNNIFLWYESENINKKKKSLFPKFQLIPILCFQVMHDYVYFIAPTDYCVE